MQHSKLIGFQTPVERIARVAGAAYDLASRPQTAPSGSISFDNADGTRTIIGPASGDGTMATHVGDTTPPGRPLGIAGASSAGVVYIAWGGKLDGGIPADFGHVTCYMSVDGVDDMVGTLTEAGIVSTVPMATATAVEVWATAEDDACLADGTPAHNVSAGSDHATVTVTQAADSAAVAKLQESITQAADDAATAKSTADGAQKSADSASDTASSAAEAAQKAQQAADAAQAQATQTAETLAQAQEYLDGIRQWVSDGQSFLGFQDVGEATAQLTIANRDSSFYTTLTNTRQEYCNGSSTIMAIDGQHGRVEASALAVGSYEWQATNSGANMTLVYIGG